MLIVAGEQATVSLVSQIVEVHSHRVASLRRVWPRVVYDLLAVLCSLRPAILLDYLPISQDMLRKLLDDVGAATGVACVVLTASDGCHTVGALGALLSHLQTMTAAGGAPVLLHGVPDGAGVVACLCPSDVAEAAGHQLSGLRNALLSAHMVQPATATLHPATAADLQAPLAGHICAAGLSLSQPREEANHPMPPPAAARTIVLDLEKIQPALPAMPTLNGMLLGYPVVYLVRCRASSAHLSRHLSCQQLQLFQLRARCTVGGAELAAPGAEPGKGGKKKPGGAPPQQDLSVLCAFTVPSALCSEDVVAGVHHWVARVQQAASRHGETWGSGVELVTEMRDMQAVSL